MTTLDDEGVRRFITDGFVPLRGAFPRSVADEGRAFLWRETGCDPDDASTWTRPVVRLGGYADEPFRAASNTPQLHAAFDRLVGPGRWVPRIGLGTFPIRFPHPDDPGDAGWHADAGFYADDGSMRVNLSSRGRALLMLFLFSDVGPDDAPTRIWVGSHLRVPALLQAAGNRGLSIFELAERLPVPPDARIELASGDAGDVFLCHPFLVHSAQPHRGGAPRFMAQPPLDPAEPLRIDRPDGAYSPVERAVRIGLEMEPPIPA